MVCRNRGIDGFFGTIVGPDYLYHMPPAIGVDSNSNQDLIWCVKVGIYMGY